MEVNRQQRTSSPRLSRWWGILAWVLVLMPSPAMARVVAVLKSDDLAAYQAPIESFTRQVDARVVVYELKGDLQKGQEVAQQLSQVPPDLVLALGAKAAYSARKYISNVPILYAMVLNPEKYQLAQPNVTGISLEVPPETIFTQYKMFAPTMSRVGVIYSAASEAQVKRAEKAAAGLGMMLVKAMVKERSEVPDAFERLKDNIDALWMVADPVAMTEETFPQLLQRTRVKKIPFLVTSENFVKAGAFVSVSPDYAAIGGQAASIAKQLMEGKKPADLPPVPPVGTHLTLNLETANAIDLKLDPLVLEFADELIGAAPTGDAGRKPAQTP